MTVKAWIAVLITIVSLLTAPAPSYSAKPEDRPIRYARGRICAVDFTGSRITVEWLYTTGKMSQNTMTFFTPGSVSVLTEKDEIFNKVRRAGITDLVIGDHVMIKYYADKNREYPEAITITVMENDVPIVP